MPQDEQKNISRRTFLAHSGTRALDGALATGVLGTLVYEAQAPTLSRLALRAPTESPGLRGLRIGFISDIHRSRPVGRRRVERAAAALDGEGLDLLLIGGDLATDLERRPTMIDEALAIFGSVRAPLGRFVVPGNHDVALRPHAPLRAAGPSGFTALTNQGVRVEHGGSALYIAGLDDQLEGVPNVGRAWHDHRGEPVLLMAHEPDGLMTLLDADHPTWLALSGHLHGGQIRLPGWGPLVRPTHFPEIFDWGWAAPQGRRAYVSRGFGSVGIPPIRLFCPPELCVFTLT